MREFSPNAVIIGAFLSILFGVSNAYLALKAGMTVSASIPAAVGALAIFSMFYKRGTILEANIVQTIASAGESLAAALSFTLPPFFILSLGFHPYSIGFLVLIGGGVGILAGMVFRRELVEDESLPFPEGRACAVVLKSREIEGGKLVIAGALSGGLIRVLQSLGLLASSYFSSIFNKPLALELSPAVVGAGAIIGFRTSLMVAAGGVMGWWALMPFFNGESLEIWSKYIRFIGAGAVLVGGIIEFIKVIFKIYSHLRNLRTFIVLLAGVVLGALAGLIIPELGLMGGVLGSLFGVIFAYVSASTTAIVGSSSNPISGMTIASLVIVALIFKLLGLNSIVSVLAFASFVASAASIAGDIIQDLKTGYIVGATPKYQFIGEFIGIAVSFALITWVISLLGSIYGFGSEKLPSPQGVLIGTITQGIFEGSIDWNLINIGGMIALAAYMLGVPVLPFAVGLYLPLHLSGGLLLGGIISKLMRGEGENILPSGIIAGDGIVSVLFAIGIGFLGWKFPEAPNWTTIITLGLLVLTFFVFWRKVKPKR
ncbi:MAG: OPT/YSL family transporter [candidate division WOR-3 bacterium]